MINMKEVLFGIVIMYVIIRIMIWILGGVKTKNRK